MNSFFRDVIAKIIQADEVFSGHADFSVADPTAVGSNPVRPLSLDVVPLDETAAILSLAWKDSAEKILEKKTTVDEAKHLFDLISVDLANAVTLTSDQKYDEAKKVMEELKKTYASTTDTPIETNLPKLNTTQSSKDYDEGLWKQAKVSLRNIFPSGTVQQMDFDTNEELVEYQEKMKGAKPNQDNIPLWEQNKGEAKPEGMLSAPSLSYEQVEKEQAQETKNLDKRIKEQVKTELESALEEKKATMFSEKDKQFVDGMRAVGRTWDEIKKYMTKELMYDSESVDMYVDDLRNKEEGVEVIEEKPEPLRPPKDLVTDETHEKLLKDIEDKKEPIVEEPKIEKEVEFTPEEIMKLPEEEVESSIARADNDDIRKVATDNPLQEPIETNPTMPTSQDTIPMGKPSGHDAPQKGDRVFVASDLKTEKAGFEASFVSNYDSKGTSFSIVETDDGDLLDVESHRVVPISHGAGAQVSEPIIEPKIEAPKEEEIKVTPSLEKLTSNLKEAKHVTKCVKPGCDKELELKDMVKNVHGAGYLCKEHAKDWNKDASQDELLSIKAEAEELLKKVAIEETCKGCGDSFQAETKSEGLAYCPQCSAILNKKEADAKVLPCDCGHKNIDHVFKGMTSPCADCDCKEFKKTASDFEKGISQDKTADEPAVEPKTQLKDVKITPDYVEKEKAIPATPEQSQVISKMQAIEANLQTLDRAKEEVKAKLMAELKKIDDAGERAALEAEYQGQIEKLSILVDAMENKIVKYGNYFYAFQQEQVKVVPKLTQKELLAKIYKRFEEAERYVKDVTNGMLSLAKSVTTRTLTRWPEKRSELEKDASISEDLSRMNEELLMALKELSLPL